MSGEEEESKTNVDENCGMFFVFGQRTKNIGLRREVNPNSWNLSSKFNLILQN